MTQEVIGCVNCPFFYLSFYDSSNNCSISKEATIERDKEFNPITPSWCPLKKESITIILKEQ